MSPPPPATPPDVDVLIVGAGLSGVGMAAHLQDECPWATFTILEGRAATGGTWDLFRYPGIRSDSDMYTMGYRFKPWNHPQTVAPGPLILDYIRETATERGIDRHIRLDHRVVSSDWDSRTARWTVTAATPDGPREFTCRFLVSAAGYYEYEKGYTPDFPGAERFGGPVIHPQHWPQDFDHAGKRILVIGSGATAVTLVPALAESAAHVTMLQRSPTYMYSAPGTDDLAVRMRERLPDMWVYRMGRFRNIGFQMFSYQMARRRPEKVKQFLIDLVAKELQGSSDIANFTPRYDPWDQRLCVVPDGDLFQAVRAGRADVVTGTIRTFTETGVELDDGTRLDADVIVTATGFSVKVSGGVRTTIDGRVFDPAAALVYRGMMFADVPNLAFIVGYTNASWTLKADLVSEYTCRVLNHMRRRGFEVVRARRAKDVREMPIMLLSAGYIQRAKDRLPKEGDRRPWRLYQNFVLDFLSLRLGRLDDGVLAFGHADAGVAAARPVTVG